MNEYEKKLEDLKNGTIKELEVDKHDFYALREALVEREDFKHFRGIAHQGGNIVYVYLEKARS
ncbi:MULTISPECIES: hypothetical protein [Rummeliibacillus]|jgi:hypothetical protein|uniref:hypothetical protein n=1 Tax=Rummeliibacillus TaxID=648802 RepID=UPI0011B6A960|nr:MULTISPECIES: hypothetical protein [Rummeliibacillus]MBO2534380.1 hypothetical protein [Rummeliibacillus suwonensis]